MSEPQYLEGDDAALKDECESCGNFIFTCECEAEDPDRMHDEMYEDQTETNDSQLCKVLQ